MHARDIVSTHPDVKGPTNQALIEASLDCAESCVSCADAGRRYQEACRNAIQTVAAKH